MSRALLLLAAVAQFAGITAMVLAPELAGAVLVGAAAAIVLGAGGYLAIQWVRS